MQQCITPITLLASQLNKNAIAMPGQEFLGKLVGGPLGSRVEDLSSSGNDVKRRRIEVIVPQIACGDLGDCYEPCTYTGTFETMGNHFLKWLIQSAEE